ncbi:MAG TPA: condensation domain-containing protein, partial [Longimicrobium sp.]|nr:condensation domain-containing protein [Longimicrobium sp.]
MNDLAERIAGLTPDQRVLLLRRLARVQIAEAPPPPPEIPRLPRTGEPLQTSPAQEVLWLIDHLDPGSPSNNVPYPVWLRGGLDPDALDRAVGEIVRRHEALRTVFEAHEGSAVQRVLPPPPGPYLLRHDLSHLPAGEREPALREAVKTELGFRMSLAEGPLLRVSLFRLAPEEHALVVLLHHIIGDGWSFGVFFRELAALYEAFRRGAPSPLAEPVLQFADWAAWQRAQVTGERGAELSEYWRKTLDGAPGVLELPTDRPRKPGLLQAGGYLPFEIGAGEGKALRALAREEGATTFMVLLALFDVLLHRWSGQADFLVGTAVANRTRVETEGTIGYFINTVVLRNRLDGDPSFRELVGRVRETASGAFARQEYPFEIMVHEVDVDTPAGYHPLIQVFFLFQNAADQLALPGLEVSGLLMDRSAAEFDLTLNTSDGDDGGVRCGLEYSADRFDAETVERMAAHLVRLAASAAAHPDTPVSALEMLDPGETPPTERPRPAPTIEPPAPEEAPALTPAAEACETRARRREALAAPGRPVAFVFPGADAVPAGALSAFAEEPAFRDAVDFCAERLAPKLGLDLREVADPAAPVDEGGWPVWTEAAEPAAFVLGHALASLWRAWGVAPAAVIGHGAGEIAAACAAGVFSAEDALELVGARALELRAVAGGGRLSVRLDEAAVAPFLAPGVHVAEVNLPGSCVLAGPRSAVAETERRLEEAGHPTLRVPATYAFGTPLGRVATARLDPLVHTLRRSAPSLPMVSASTGGWMAPSRATLPFAWARHHRDTVRFADGVRAL